MNPAPIGFFKPVERFYLFVSLIALLVLGLLITTLAFENYFFLIRCGAICMRLQVPLLYTILPGSLLILFGVVGLVTNFSFAAKRSFQFDKLGFVSGLAMIGLGASLEFDSHSSLLACSRSNELLCTPTDALPIVLVSLGLILYAASLLKVASSGRVGYLRYFLLPLFSVITIIGVYWTYQEYNQIHDYCNVFFMLYEPIDCHNILGNIFTTEWGWWMADAVIGMIGLAITGRRLLGQWKKRTGQPVIQNDLNLHASHS